MTEPVDVRREGRTLVITIDRPHARNAIDLATATGAPLSAQDAHRWGLVNLLTAPGEALPAALRLAAKIAANGPLAVRTTKHLVAGSGSWSAEQAWAVQDEQLLVVVESADAKEGAAAFVDKRPPVWQVR